MAEGNGVDRQRRELAALVCRAMAAAAFLGSAVAANNSAASEAPVTHVITIEGMRFNPEVLSVRKADRVVWVNKDLFPHTATAEGKAFDSGNIAPNASWRFEARAVGDFAYVCALHPTMKGQVIVQ